MRKSKKAVIAISVVVAVGWLGWQLEKWWNTEQCPCKNQGRLWITRSDGNNFQIQVAAAKRHGVPYIETEADLDSLVDEGVLSRLPWWGDGFEVDLAQFTHSAPYYSTQTIEAFTAFAQEFQNRMQGAGIEDARLVVSSGSRTKEQQDYLARHTSGAVHGQSPHNYGAAIDISTIKHHACDESQCDQSRQILKAMLKESDEFHWVLERACLHLTIKPK